MPNRLLGRIKKLEEKLMPNKTPLIIFQRKYGETKEQADERLKEAKERCKREYKGTLPIYVLITDFGECEVESYGSVSDFKTDKKGPEKSKKQLQKQIDDEVEKLKSYGYTEREIEEAIKQTDSDEAGSGIYRPDGNGNPASRIDNPDGNGNRRDRPERGIDLSRLMR